MNKKRIRQAKMLQILSDQGTGVVSMYDEQLSIYLKVSKKTIQRDLEEMNYKNIIIKQTKLITINGKIRTQRDIIIPDQPKRRFSIDDHKFLSHIENHNIFVENNEVIWMRRPDGIHWERCLIEKEFDTKNQALQWMFYALSTHKDKYINGSSYKSRGYGAMK